MLDYAAHSIPVHLPTGVERDGVLAAIVEYLADLADAIPTRPSTRSDEMVSLPVKPICEFTHSLLARRCREKAPF